jgi:hypothetical protein
MVKPSGEPYLNLSLSFSPVFGGAIGAAAGGASAIGISADGASAIGKSISRASVIVTSAGGDADRGKGAGISEGVVSGECATDLGRDDCRLAGYALGDETDLGEAAEAVAGREAADPLDRGRGDDAEPRDCRREVAASGGGRGEGEAIEGVGGREEAALQASYFVTLAAN